MRREVRSYRDLPLNLYQIQSKFRDEIRPRFGLMRGREFIMKDAYSFHVDYADCEREYDVMSAAYTRIFERCGLRFRPVEAATGAIGGSKSHEFQVLAESGEDALVSCDRCGYAANVEKAGIQVVPPPTHGGTLRPMRKVATPGQRTIEEVSAFLGVPPDRFIKTLLYVDRHAARPSRRWCAATTSSARPSCSRRSAVSGWRWPTPRRCERLHRRGGRLRRTARAAHPRARRSRDCAAWRARWRARTRPTSTSSTSTRSATCRISRFADLRVAQPGDPCARCPDGVYEGHRGIEVGQVFYLGTKYSQAMKAHVSSTPRAHEQPMEMGCYGIGITRTAAAAIEQNHDDNGIIWPMPLAPAHVHLIAVNPKDAAQREAAGELYDELPAAGVEVLFDDREERPGVKFKDADLIGIPLRVTIGPKALGARRASSSRAARETAAQEMPLADAVERLAALVRDGTAR